MKIAKIDMWESKTLSRQDHRCGSNKEDHVNSIELDIKNNVVCFNNNKTKNVFNLNEYLRYYFEPIGPFRFCGIPLKHCRLVRWYKQNDGRIVEEDDIVNINDEWVKKIVLNIDEMRLYVSHNKKAYSGYEHPIEIFNLKNYIQFMWTEFEK